MNQSLKENIKKTAVVRLLGLLEIVGVVALALLLYNLVPTTDMQGTTGIYILLLILCVCILTGWFADKYMDKQMKKWIVPELERPDMKTYLKLGTITRVLLGLVFIGVGYYMLTQKAMLIFSFFVVGYLSLLEFNKWKKFNKSGTEPEAKNNEPEEVPIESELGEEVKEENNEPNT